MMFDSAHIPTLPGIVLHISGCLGNIGYINERVNE